MPSRVQHLQYGPIDLHNQAARNPAFELYHCFDSPVANPAGYSGEHIAEHFNALCALPATTAYRHAFARWQRTLGAMGAVLLQATIDIRLLIGLTQPSLWETNLYLNPLYGTPWIPGSSGKGSLRHFIERYLIAAEGDEQALSQGYVTPEVFNYLFGSVNGAGLVVVHDAWWLPDSAPAAAGRHRGEAYPLVRETVTPHHPDFLGSAGQKPATPFDSPQPVPQLAAHGAFLFAIAPRRPEDKLWAQYAAEYLKHALRIEGIGARTPEYGRATAKLA